MKTFSQFLIEETQSPLNQQIEYYETTLSYLVNEGYAETLEEAEDIYLNLDEASRSRLSNEIGKLAWKATKAGAKLAWKGAKAATKAVGDYGSYFPIGSKRRAVSDIIDKVRWATLSDAEKTRRRNAVHRSRNTRQGRAELAARQKKSQEVGDRWHEQQRKRQERRRARTGRYRNVGAGSRESVREMKTYSQFISEGKLRQLTIGPSRSSLGRQRQQRDASERAAFKKAGVRRNRPGTSTPRRANKIGFKAVPGEYTSTAITTYPNQSSHAKDVLQSKVDDRTNRVVKTGQRALQLRRLSRQTGNRSSRQVHAVDILPKKDFKKDDPKELITRGKEYHSSVKNISSNIKKVSGGKPGDVIVGKAAEVMPGSKDIKKGRKKREELYSRVLGASKRDPITNIQSARVKE